MADEWDEHSREALDDVERHVFNPVNYFLMAKHFAVDWQQTIDHYFATETNQRMTSFPSTAGIRRLCE